MKLTSPRSRRLHHALAAAAIVVLGENPVTIARDATVEIASSGIAIVASPSLVLRRMDIALDAERIRIDYVVTNLGAEDVNSLITWPQPDIDMTAIGDGALALPATDPDNVTRHEITSNGARVTPKIERSASAYRLDVTATLREHTLDLFPLADSVLSKLAALPNPVADHLRELGIVRLDGSRRLPGWTYRSTLFWRQTFKADGDTTISIAFAPVLGSGTLGPDSVDSFSGTHCLPEGRARAIQKKLEAGESVDAVWLTHALTFGSSWSGPVKHARITIAVPDSETAASTCYGGFKPAGPTLLEWKATDFEPHSDLSILFLR
ncbi:MAG TPA: DUF4424 family protein [Hyphomicrobiaceae bacterium]|nr:DUF4424 family protein [Hyphomicrobiaceae bacterium]